MSQAIPVSVEKMEFVKLSRLKVLQDDLKDLTKENYEKLKAEILTHGITDPINVWPDPDAKPSEPDLGILDGTQRFRVVSRMMTEGFTIDLLPVVFVKAPTLRDAILKLLGMAGMYGTPTDEGLYALMQKHNVQPGDVPNIVLPGINVPRFFDGYFNSEEAHDGTDEDSVPEPPKTPRSKKGELWLLGEHRLLCGDATSAKDFKLLLGPTGADFCFTSPPYADMRDYTGDGDMSPDHLSKFLSAPCRLWAVNLGIVRKDRQIFPYWDKYIERARELGLKFLSWNIWDKLECGSVGNQTAMFGIRHEWILVFGDYRGLNRTVPNASAGVLANHTGNRQKDGTVQPNKNPNIVRSHRQLDTVLQHTPLRARNLDLDHPAMFPVGLPKTYIEACSDEGAEVYEPFGGAGTTLIACEALKRKARVMEISPGYCDVILQRWSDYTGRDPVREDGVKWSEIKLGKPVLRKAQAPRHQPKSQRSR